MDLFYMIRRKRDGACYRIKKGRSSFVESPGFGPSLFSSERKAWGILKQHLASNPNSMPIPEELKTIRLWTERRNAIREFIKEHIDKAFEVIKVSVVEVE